MAARTAKFRVARPLSPVSEAHTPLHEDQLPRLVLTEATAVERAMIQLRLIFHSIDTDEDRSVSKDELMAALSKDVHFGILLKEAGLNPNFRILEQLDMNKDGRVTWDEFETNLKEAAVKQVRAAGHVVAVETPAAQKALVELKSLFERIDKNHDGSVSQEELAFAVSSNIHIGKLIEQAGLSLEFDVLEQLDTDSTGQISWDEFQEKLREAAKEEVKEKGVVSAAHHLVEVDSGVVTQCCWCMSVK